jgi:hypothetical protein
MRMRLALSVIALWPATALAGDDFTSSYTKIDLAACRQTQKPDDYIFEGAWRCTGIPGYDIFQAGADARSFAGFGATADNNCAYLKTFTAFNTALSPVEWRYHKGQPIAAIERWSVSRDGTAGSVTWLVVNALKNGTSCHIAYVAGSYPGANEAARQAADSRAETFDCENDVPAVESTIGSPPIELNACKDIANE